MKLLCRMGVHEWDRCTCTRCGEWRPNHCEDRDGRCARCGKLHIDFAAITKSILPSPLKLAPDAPTPVSAVTLLPSGEIKVDARKSRSWSAPFSRLLQTPDPSLADIIVFADWHKRQDVLDWLGTEAEKWEVPSQLEHPGFVSLVCRYSPDEGRIIRALAAYLAHEHEDHKLPEFSDAHFREEFVRREDAALACALDCFFSPECAEAPAVTLLRMFRTPSAIRTMADRLAPPLLETHPHLARRYSEKVLVYAYRRPERLMTEKMKAANDTHRRSSPRSPTRRRSACARGQPRCAPRLARTTQPTCS